MSKRFMAALVSALGLVMAMMPSAITQANEPGLSGKVLVFGNSDNGFERDNLGETLNELGANVDVVRTLPDDLSQYDAVWNVDVYSGLTKTVESALIAFVKQGGSLYLTGERPCCEGLNASAERIINAVVEGPQVTVGRQGDVQGPFTFNPNAVGGISRFPNVLVDFVPQSPGGLLGIGGISGRNVFASNDSIAVGGAWDETDLVDGVGRLVILMDIDWLGSEARLPIIHNIHSFLSKGAACAALDAHPYITWATDLPENCSTLVIGAPTTIDFHASVPSGTVDVTVSTRNVQADCVPVSDGPTSRAQRCTISGATSADSTLTITATSSNFGSTSLFYRVQSKNDPRNVPEGHGLNSNWWEWPDSDNDGIPDKWETDGVWTSNGFLDLPGLGADPSRADLFVYAEHQSGFEVSENVLEHAKKTFRDSPLNGDQGVELHIVRGGAIPANIIDNMVFDYRPNQAGLDQDAQNSFQRVATYSGFLSSVYAGGNGVPQLFKWWLNYDRTATEDDGVILGQAVINGNLLWTSVESQWEQWDPSASSTAREWTRAVTLVHELGHTLGLGHGGADLNHPRNQSAYRSVMSYAYSLTGVVEVDVYDPLYRITVHNDYSRRDLVNRDWRFREPGAHAYGSLVFVQGQLGEHGDFYDRSFVDWFDFTGEVTEPHMMDAMTREILPSDYDAFAEHFGFESDLVFPEVKNVETWIPSDLPILHLQVRNLDPADGHVLVDVSPEHGTITSNGVGIEYTPTEGFSGEDSVTLRVSDGSLSSAQITIAIRVVAEEPVEPSVSPSAPSSPPTASPNPTPSPPTASPNPTPSPPTASPNPTPTINPHTDLYSTPGYHEVNGRKWFTQCEEYSQTKRCRTSIWATTVKYDNGGFTARNGWQFNNLTYLPYMKRSQWASNPLGFAGTWTSEENRRWYTECDTSAVGGNGCRSYVWASFIEAGLDAQGNRKYTWSQGWVFNNIVRFL